MTAVARRWGLAAGCVLALAQGGAAQDLTRWEGALLSGSPRLAAFGLLRDRPAGGARAAARLLHGEGMIGDGRTGPALLAHQATVRPLLRWDDNINGGIPGDTISMGGADWTIDPQSRARAGLVLGAAAQGALRYRLGQGRVVMFAGQASWVRAPAHGLSRTEAASVACLAQALPGWRFVDFCGGLAQARTDLSQSRQHWLSLRGTQLFEAAGAVHEASVGVRQSWRETYDQRFVDLALTSAVPRIGAIGVRLSLGEAVRGVNTLRHQASVSLARPVFGRPARISLEHAREEGARLFGLARRDEIWGLTLEQKISAELSARLTAQRRASNVAAFSENRVVLELSWQPAGLRW